MTKSPPSFSDIHFVHYKDLRIPHLVFLSALQLDSTDLSSSNQHSSNSFLVISVSSVGVPSNTESGLKYTKKQNTSSVINSQECQSRWRNQIVDKYQFGHIHRFCNKQLVRISCSWISKDNNYKNDVSHQSIYNLIIINDYISSPFC